MKLSENVSFSIAVTFENPGDGTKITMHSTFYSAGKSKRVVKEYGAIKAVYKRLAGLTTF